MSRYEETNPHFWPQPQPDIPGPYQQLEPEPRLTWDSHPDEIPQQPDRIQRRSRQWPSRSPTPAIHPRPRQPQPSHLSPPPPPRHPQPQQSYSPPGAPPAQPWHRQPQPSWDPQTPPSSHLEHARQPPPLTPPPPHQHSPGTRPAHPQPQLGLELEPHRPNKHRPPRHARFEPPPHESLMYPTPSKTKPITWFGAVFCVILWLVIILGGLLVLIIYLLYRPQTPRFQVSSATLNAAYLDMGYLLNADLTVLANFTNPNKKAEVEFGYVTLRLYFGGLLIANQYVGPFSAVNTGSKLVNVEFVSSQIRLPPKVTQQFITQMQRDRITFEVRGDFHATSSFGSLLRYSYWLYGHCIIEMTGPPTGVMIANKCRAKE